MSKREKYFAMSRYARLLVSLDDEENAKYYYKKVIDESDELELKCRFQLSKLYYSLNNKTEALNILEIEGFNNRYLNIKRSFIYLLFEEFDNALRELKREEENVANYKVKENIEDEYLDQEENYIKGHIYYKYGRVNKAMPYLRKALTIKNRMYYVSAYLDLASTHIMRYEIDKAISICEELLKETTNEDFIIKINHILSKAYLKKQDYDKVKESLNKAIFDEKITVIKLGKLELLRGNFEKAEEHLKILDIENDDVNELYEAFYLNVLVKFRLEKYDEALYILDLIEENAEKVELKEMQYEFDRIRLCILKRQNKEAIPDISSYSQRQIVAYSKEDALRHIISHHMGETAISKFQTEDQVRQIFNSVGDLLVEDNVIYDSSYDKYIIKYNSVGCGFDNNTVHQLLVVTLPGTKDIITMYPLSGDKSMIITEEYDKPEGKKIKRLSQIEKFNKRYNNS